MQRRIVTKSAEFPHPATVMESGILAFYGELSVSNLLLAYNYGIFPWYGAGEPIIWWCPNPRYVIFPERVKIQKSMRSYFNQDKFTVSFNQCFVEVVNACKTVDQRDKTGTWITEEMLDAYTQLFHSGYAMSVEVWEEGKLVGGLYGVMIAKVFFGESMFAYKSNASKFGFISLAQKLVKDGFECIDCQQPNPHLESLGGEFISGEDFHSILRKNRFRYLAESTI